MRPNLRILPLGSEGHKALEVYFNTLIGECVAKKYSYKGYASELDYQRDLNYIKLLKLKLNDVFLEINALRERNYYEEMDNDREFL